MTSAPPSPQSLHKHGDEAGPLAALPCPGHDFSAIPVHACRQGILQPKLAIDTPGDRYEQEADHIAERVTRRPQAGSHLDPTTTGSSQGSSQLPHGQRSLLPLDGTADLWASTPIGHVMRASPSRGLDPATRGFMGGCLGHDFSTVRVHTGWHAAQTARALGARAYTVGQDVVFGEGQYAPETGEGQRLLAHELAHVVQQSHEGAGPMIQRRLLVDGDKADVKTMLKLLEPPSDLRLQHDAKTRQVTITKSGGKPPSPSLAATLTKIIGDPKQDAEILLGQTFPGVFFGAFPQYSTEEESQNPVQKIRIDHMQAAEKGAAGVGVANLAHEITENFEAHALTDQRWEFAFEPSHDIAQAAEDSILGELGHAGPERALFPVQDTAGKRSFIRWIEDRTTHFVIYDNSSDGRKMTQVRRVPRVPVSTHRFNGFTAGSSALAPADQAIITTLASAMEKNPTASALIESFATPAAPKKDAKGGEKLAAERADLIQDQVIATVNKSDNTHWRRFHQVAKADPSLNTVVITLERPDL